MEIKLVISYPDGKTEQKELKGEEAERFIGYKIGDSFDGKSVGLSDSLKITGGSDKDGFPMKKGVYGTRREKLLLARGIGYRPQDDGIRKKKRVRGDTITEEIVQINTKVEEKKKPAKKKAAAKPKKETAAKKEKAAAEEAPAEEAPVEEAPVEEAPAEEAPVEEAPAEEAPVEEEPVEEAPAEEAPVEEEPVEDAPEVEEPPENKEESS